MTPSTTFGALLRQVRKRAGMTQSDLAAAVGYSVSFVCDLEQNRRLPVVAVVLQQFIPALGLQDEAALATRLVELAAVARGERPPATLTVQRTTQLVVTETFTRPTSHLPALPTELIGREQEVKTLCHRLQGHSGRLLTLTGPPGVGKTSLGLEVARRLEPLFKDGARFVPLAAISDPELVATTIANELKFIDTGRQSPQERLIQGLRRQELLLVLDNFEQIIAAAPLLATVLAECPRLHLLATSRERLHLRAEQRFPVLPLALTFAVTLFVQRAQLVEPTFALTVENQATVEKICRQLDRLPLAIELIAARIDLLSLQSMLTHLQEHRLNLLTDGTQDMPARHRTLRRAIQHSYDLLAEHERRLFRTLGVFVGGFDLAAVVHFGFTETELQALVHKHLVGVEIQAAGEQRFLLQGTLREYALEQLAQANEAETVQRTHALYFFELAKQTVEELVANDWSIESHYLSEQEVDNLRAAHRWVATHGAATQEMQFLNQLSGLWWSGRYLREVDRWVEAALPRIKPESTFDYAYFLYVLAQSIGYRQGNLATAQTYAEESLLLYRQLDYPFSTVGILELLAHIHHGLGNHVAARAVMEECVSIARKVSRPAKLANLLGSLWDILIDLDDQATTQAVLHEIVSIYRSLEGSSWQALALRALAEDAFLQGDISLARAQCEEALQLLQRLNDPWEISRTLLLLSRITYRQGDKARVTIVLGELLPLARTLGAQTLLYSVLLLTGLTAQENDELLCAQALLTEGLALAQKNAFLYDKGRQQAKAAYILGGLAGLCGSSALAARLLGTVPKLLSTSYRFRKLVVEHAHYERILTTVRAQLDETTYTSAYAEGYAMTPDQAVAFALAQFDGPAHSQAELSAHVC